VQSREVKIPGAVLASEKEGEDTVAGKCKEGKGESGTGAGSGAGLTKGDKGFSSRNGEKKTFGKRSASLGVESRKLKKNQERQRKRGRLRRKGNWVPEPEKAEVGSKDQVKTDELRGRESRKASKAEGKCWCSEGEYSNRDPELLIHSGRWVRRGKTTTGRDLRVSIQEIR